MNKQPLPIPLTRREVHLRALHCLVGAIAVSGLAMAFINASETQNGFVTAAEIVAALAMTAISIGGEWAMVAMAVLAVACGCFLVKIYAQFYIMALPLGLLLAGLFIGHLSLSEGKSERRFFEDTSPAYVALREESIRRLETAASWSSSPQLGKEVSLQKGLGKIEHRELVTAIRDLRSDGRPQKWGVFLNRYSSAYPNCQRLEAAYLGLPPTQRARFVLVINGQQITASAGACRWWRMNHHTLGLVFPSADPNLTPSG